MTAETFVVDAATRHAVFVQRFAGSETLKAQATLERMRQGVVGRLTRNPTDFQANRLTALLNDIEGIIGAVMVDLAEDTLETVEELAVNEAAFANELVQKTTTVVTSLPSDALLTQVVIRSGMAAPVGPTQITIQEALDQFAGKKSLEVLNTIQDGMLAGDTLPQTTAKVSELVDTRQKRQVEALTRTIMNHTSNQASEAVFVENAALFKGVEWVSVLDGRTTFICAGRDGRIFPVGRGPRPPAHWGCRSQALGVVKDEFSVPGIKGRRGFVGGKIDADGNLVGKRGQVRGDVDFSSFLSRQPAAFQDEYLGPARGKLFRQGGLPITAFRDETGRVFSLKELRKTNALAFDEAGVKLDANGRVIRASADAST